MICFANRFTDFNMRATLEFNKLHQSHEIGKITVLFHAFKVRNKDPRMMSTNVFLVFFFLAGVVQISCSEKFPTIHRKIPAIASLISKVTDLNANIFLQIQQNISEQLFHRISPDECFCTFSKTFSRSIRWFYVHIKTGICLGMLTNSKSETTLQLCPRILMQCLLKFEQVYSPVMVLV